MSSSTCYDYGRQIQTAFVSDRGAAHEANPTEAGSRFSAWPGSHKGSPCVRAANVLPATQVTSASPFEYEPTRWGGGYRRPFLWKDVRIGKEITLDYLGLGPVGPLRQPRDRAGGRAELGCGDSSVSCMPASAGSTATTPPRGRCRSRIRRPSKAGRCRRRATAESSHPTPDGSRAFGQYGVVDSLGGSVTPAAGGFSYFLFPDPTDTLGPAANATAKIRALHGGLVRGENRMTTYLMSGTLAEVTALMDSLYAHREVAR